MTTVAAIFDVDGTLVRANALNYYCFFLRRLFSPLKRGFKLSAMSWKLPYWKILDQFDRNRFNKSFYSQYRGFPAEPVHRLAPACFEEVFRDRLVLEVVARATEHIKRGDRILLISGSLDFIVNPLAGYLQAEATFCSSLEEREGRFTGKLSGQSMTGKAKADGIMSYARERGIDLSKSFGYGDDLSDIPFLTCVGHPVVVNPGRKLFCMAREHGWEILPGKGGL